MSDNVFIFEDNETYIDRCGEIFRTSKGRISFHCTLCESQFKEFLSYLNHIFKEHKSDDEYMCNDNPDSSDEYFCNETEYDDLNFELKAEFGSTMMEDEGSVIDSTVLKEEDKAELFDCPIIKPENQLVVFDPSTLIQEENELSNLSKVTSDAVPTERNVNEESKEEISNHVRKVRKRVLTNPKTSSQTKLDYKCPVCGLGFSVKANMRHHLNRHSNEKKHQCPKCEKKFYAAYEIKVHMRCHTQERPFLCSECGNSYPTNALLANHMKRHRNQRDFKCTQCDKSFYDKSALLKHSIKHEKRNEQIKFNCTICDANFVREESFRNHKKIHEMIAPYKCEICETGFNQKVSLASHKKRRHRVIF